MRRSVLLAVLAVAALLGLGAGALLGANETDGQGTATQEPAPGSAAPAGGAEGGGGDGAAGAVPSAALPTLKLESVAGTFSQPLFLTSPPGDASRLFVVEKTGRIRIVKDGVLLQQPFLDVSGLVSDGGEQGLLGLAFHPRYGQNGRFYIDYTNRSGDTRVARYVVSASDPDRADPASRRVLLRVDQPYSNHNGGHLAFGPDGRLYVGMGDGGSAGDPLNRAQADGSRLGKLLRITLGTSPLRVVNYAKGLRNPWRFSFDRETGTLWIGDVGQNALEEIDRLRAGRPAGANLGWSGFEGTRVFNARRASRLDRDRLVWPVEQYGRDVGQSVTGGYVYRGTAIPQLVGTYLFADFASGRVWAFSNGGRTRLAGVDGELQAISSFGEDAAGELYVVSLEGSVHKIVPSP